MFGSIQFTLLSVCMGILALFKAVEGTAHVKLDLYYESLCPDSAKFINEHLYPLLIQFGGVENEYLEAEFIPYGKATTDIVNGSFNFTCQHGPPECDGNRVHACALEKYSRKDSVAFVNCSIAATAWGVFKWPLPEPFISGDPDCIKNLGLSQLVMDDCLSSWESNVMLAYHGIRTKNANPRIYYLPWIVIDGHWDVDQLEVSQKDLKSIVCKRLKHRGVDVNVCN